MGNDHLDTTMQALDELHVLPGDIIESHRETLMEETQSNYKTST